MLKKIILGIFGLVLLIGLILWLVITGQWTVVEDRLLEVGIKWQQAINGGQQTTDVETLLATPEDGYFAEAGIQKFREKIEAPGFTLKNLEGQDVSLKDFQGKWVLLNFWATWCGPCRIEKPTIEKLYQAFKDKGLVILAISIDQGDSVQLVKSYMEEHKLTYGALLDPENTATKAYAVRGIPATYLIDTDGYIIGGAMGVRLWDKGAVRKLVAHLLDKSETSLPEKSETSLLDKSENK